LQLFGKKAQVSVADSSPAVKEVNSQGSDVPHTQLQPSSPHAQLHILHVWYRHKLCLAYLCESNQLGILESATTQAAF